MKQDKLGILAVFLRANKQNPNKKLLLDYMQEQICKYANQEYTPAEQIKGMNRLLRDIARLDNEVFEDE